MKKFLQKKLNNEKGMTLIELLAVIVIIAIIAAIAIPAIGNIIQNSRIDAARADALNVINAANLYETERGNIPAAGIKVSDLTAAGFLDDAGKVPDSAEVFTGPALSGTIPDVLGTNGIVLTKATSKMINDAGSTADLRTTLEKGNLAIPTTTTP